MYNKRTVKKLLQQMIRWEKRYYDEASVLGYTYDDDHNFHRCKKDPSIKHLMLSPQMFMKKFQAISSDKKK